MGDYLTKDQIEKVPYEEVSRKEDCNFIPVFPIQQKNKVRIVFDSSAKCNGKSINDSLLQGPDVKNTLLGVLIRFRDGPIGYAADVERMFHSFYVQPSDWDKMRFYWYDKNDPNEKIVQYRSKVHVFGNRSSPAIATYGLRYTAKDIKDEALKESCYCIHNSLSLIHI